MLNIYYSREDRKRDSFIFDHIQGSTLLLVPDQFTLQAERDAFFYLGARGLMDVEIVSISRLGQKVLKEVGGGRTTLISKYGRHMLLAKIIGEKNEELDIYRGLERKSSFIEMVNNFISELKQYGTDPAGLKEIMDDLDANSFLRRKLADMERIFTRYQEQIQGKYLDTEDYVSLYAGKIHQSEKLRRSRIWIYGFDAFTPKNLEVIAELMKTAGEVNIVLTYAEEGRDQDIFQLTGNVISRLVKLAKEGGIQWRELPIPEEYSLTPEEKSAAILTLEQELYSIPAKPAGEHQGITLVEAANLYAEAESAAAQVLRLVRDEGLLYKDIVLICNDMETRGSIIKRVFAEYGIDLFLDRKRSILHSPAISYVLSLLEISAAGYRTDAIFRLLKTGLTDLRQERIDDLENYVIKYKIRGNLWKRPFTKGTSEYTGGALEKLEETRQAVVHQLEAFSSRFKEAGTVREQVLWLYTFLQDEVRLPDKLELRIRDQEKAGFFDAAEETAQIWGILVDILDQLVEIVGEEERLASSFSDIFKAGVEAVEVGMLPPTADGIILGTMQRTRTSRVEAMLVLGANEGVLPASGGTEGILNEDEKTFLFGKDVEISKLEEIRLQEEKLAIYKNLSKPFRYLWLSYSASDVEGKEIKPSSIFEKIVQIFPRLQVEKDILNRADPLELIQARENTIKHMTQALRQVADGESLALPWQEAILWYQEKGNLDRVVEGLFFTNKQEALGKELIDKLYKGDGEILSLSPSGLERYSRCPFAHFVNYGLRPEERRLFEIGGREIGDLYHTCLMELSRFLTREGVPVSSEESPWMNITKEECTEKVEEILRRETWDYREGLLASGNEAEYRRQRLSEIAGEIGWILIDQVRRGSIKAIAFEETFGRGRSIPPVEIPVNGETVVIEGKIDRVDVLPDDRVKIIDYKTGREKFDIDQARKGFKLQLMLYLKAAQKKERQPAGVFYFLIDEPSVDVAGADPEKVPELVEKETKRSFKLDGIMVNDPQVIESIAGDFEGYSDIAPIKKSQKGIAGTTPDKLLEEEDFTSLQTEVDEKVEQLCGALISGNIPIHPKKAGTISACTYCPYKGICQFDQAFAGCRFEII